MAKEPRSCRRCGAIFSSRRCTACHNAYRLLHWRQYYDKAKSEQRGKRWAKEYAEIRVLQQKRYRIRRALSREQ